MPKPIEPNDARQGIELHAMRYVLAASLAFAVLTLGFAYAFAG